MLSPRVSPAVAGHTSASVVAPRLLAVLTLVILCAGAARLFGLDHLLVWHDEVFTLIRVFGYQQGEAQSAIFSGQLLSPDDLLRFQLPAPDRTWGDAFKAFAEHPEHAPLYYVLARLATGLPLDPVTATRGVSALFGLLLIPAVYWLMRELVGRGPVPWIAATLVACSPLQFLYAQEARQYALWLLLLVAASAALTRALRRDSRTDWWLYGLLMTLGCYAHLLFLLMIPVHGLYGLLTATEGRPQPGRLRRLTSRWAISVGAALLLFTPWLWVIATQPDRVGDFTSWMQRPIGLGDILAAWSRHLVQGFVDLSPQPSDWWALMLLPLAWMLARFLRRAPRSALWLLVLTALAYIGVVLGPDLLLGGSRSLHARYVLPALLSIQLMTAWVIGTAVAMEPGTWSHRLGLGALTLLIGLGGLSLAAIERADTWPTKNFSARNAEIARIANDCTQCGQKGTLVVASGSGVATGELISLAYHLKPEARIWGQPSDRPAVIPTGFETIIALTPSDRLRETLRPEHPLTPLADTWQWFAVGTPRTTPATILNPGLEP